MQDPYQHIKQWLPLNDSHKLSAFVQLGNVFVKLILLMLLAGMEFYFLYCKYKRVVSQALGGKGGVISQLIEHPSARPYREKDQIC